MDEQSIFLEALQKETPEERAAFLAEACGDDEGVRHEIEMLLKAHHKVGSFLQGAPAGIENTLDQPITEKPGTQIGPYKLLQQIGEGGMGVVYMAEQKEPVKRRVALKIIKPGMDTRQVITRFEAERQALAMMDHPNIAKVLDAGATESGRPYFVMELVNGLPVTNYCDEQHLTPKERLELFVAICEAVQHAHQKGIIHRDLKPSNILVAEYDHRAVPKIIDFGVAKATTQTLTEKTMFTQLDQIVGTLEYMSPEQAKRNQLDIDTRSDIYSLGVVLYELLTGETPFDRERLRSAAFEEMLRIIREEEPSKPSTKVSSSQSLPSIAANRRIDPAKLGSMMRGELDWIVLKAMEKDRGRRYETASKFAEDVQHYLNDEAVVACPPSRAYRFRKFARRNKTLIGTMAVVAASLIAGIIGTSWQAYRATKAEEVAEDRLGIVESQKEEIEQEKQNAIAEAKRADKETKTAKTALAVADAVSDFLANDLLGMSDPDRQAEQGLAPDPDLKVRTLLDRAAEKLQGRFPDTPQVEVRLRSTLGAAYRGVDATDEAEKHLQRALLLAREHFSNKTWLMTLLLEDLAHVYRQQFRFDEAIEAAEEVYEIRRQALGEEDSRTLSAMLVLAGAYNAQKKYAEAESLLSRRLEILRRSKEADDLDVMRTEHNLASVQSAQGEHARAALLFSDLLSRRQRILPADHPDILRNKCYLGNELVQLGRYDEAEPLLRDARVAARRTWGVDHYSTLMVERTLAEVMALQRRYNEAIELEKPLLDIHQNKYGHGDPRTVELRRHLATIYSDCAQYSALHPNKEDRSQDETIEFAQRAVALNPEAAKHRAILGLVHTRFEQWEQAAQIFEQLANSQPQRLGAYGFTAAVAYWKSGRRELALKQYAISRQEFEDGHLPNDESIGQMKREADEVMSNDAPESDQQDDHAGEGEDQPRSESTDSKSTSK